MAALTTLNPNRRAASAYEREESRQLALYNYAKDKEKKVLDLARKKKSKVERKTMVCEKSHDLDFKGEEVTQWLNNVTYTVEAETWNLN